MRAVAVLSVVFFHLSRHVLPGGYLGVDMFFVISGYLITAIIRRETQQGQFSIVRFYDRRIRRVMPALLLVLLVTSVASSVLLLPQDLVGYARSLLATLIFSANIYFWRDTDYFSAAAEQKPLLHVWSLGVEEQFYILFPLILLLLARRWPRGTVPAIAALTMVSLAVDVAAISAGAGLPAFFLLPTRAWELGVGALLALTPPNSAPLGRSADGCAFLGALLIGGGIIHPWDALRFVPVGAPVVAGTALMILAGMREPPFMNGLLASRPSVFLGRISYSLYLWHWPIIVLSQYYLVRPLNGPEVLFALPLMVACSTASWRFVERPFRSTHIPIRTVRVGAALCAVCLGAVAVALLDTQGLPGRLNAQATVLDEAVDSNYRCGLSDYLVFGASRACILNLPSRRVEDADVVLLGNSHAQMYAPLWASILVERGRSAILVPANGCLPTVQVNIDRGCFDIAQRNLAAVGKLPGARTVIVGLNWWHGPGELVDPRGRVLDNTGGRAFAAALDDLIDRLRAAGKQVVVIGPIVEPGWPVASVLSRQIAFGHVPDRALSVPAPDFNRRFGSLIHHFEGRSDITFARPDRAQCDIERCYFVIDGRSLFADATHIAAGELPRFRDIFLAALPVVTDTRRRIGPETDKSS